MTPEEMTALLETLEAREVPDEEFEECAKKAGAMEGLSDEQRLLFYGLYKVSSDCLSHSDMDMLFLTLMMYLHRFLY